MGHDHLRSRLNEVTGLDLPVEDWAKEEGIADEEIRERVLKAANERYEAKRAKYTPRYHGPGRKGRAAADPRSSVA